MADISFQDTSHLLKGSMCRIKSVRDVSEHYVRYVPGPYTPEERGDKSADQLLLLVPSPSGSVWTGDIANTMFGDIANTFNRTH